MKIARNAGISDSEASTQRWAATIAFMALQTTNYNVTTAQVPVCKGLCVPIKRFVPSGQL